MTLGLGLIARPFTRQMYFRIENRQQWHQAIVVDNPLLEKLKFWLQHVHAFNGYAIPRTLSATSIVYSDMPVQLDTEAIKYNSAIFIAQLVYGLVKSRSTCREMKAILNVLSRSKILCEIKQLFGSPTQPMQRV